MKYLALLMLCFMHYFSFSQSEEDFELMAEKAVDDGEIEMEESPASLNLNIATASELTQLNILTSEEINNILSYREVFGPFIDKYELLAVPGLSYETIRKLVSLVDVSIKRKASDLKKGNHQVLFRIYQVLEKSKGYMTGKYQGNRQQVLLRNTYRYKNVFSYNITAEKDPGEPWFGKKQKGFDFYSAHLAYKPGRLVDEIIFGDYTVKTGQGLIQWQGSSAGRGIGLATMKRQSPVLMPYKSVNEYEFYRGIAAGFRLSRRFSGGMFISKKPLSLTISNDTATGIYKSGLFRSSTELQKKNNSSQFSSGMYVKFIRKNISTGINVTGHFYQHAFKKSNDLYALFDFEGRRSVNASVDYNYTWQNFHLFGEAAFDQSFNFSMITGLLISASKNAELMFVYRNAAPGFHAQFGKAFMSSASPGNEKGIYAAGSFKFRSLQVNLHVDLQQYPWLRYQVNQPSVENTFHLSTVYKPDKKTEISARLRLLRKTNNAGDAFPMQSVIEKRVTNFRFHFSRKISEQITLRGRTETVHNKSGAGFLIYADLVFKPLLKPMGGNIRMLWFETSDYATRIYSFENDVYMYNSIPAFSGTGRRIYINMYHDLNEHCRIWAKAASTSVDTVDSVGSGEDTLPGNKKTEIRLQFIFILK